MYEAIVYDEIILEETGLALAKKGADATKKWADRVRNLLKRAGKPSDDGTLMVIKLRVAQKAAALGASALMNGRSGPIESMITTLKSRLK